MPSSSGESSAQVAEGLGHLRSAVRGPEHQATDDHRAHRVQLELQCRDHTEVAATTLARPEQVLVLRLVGADLTTVGGHQLHGQQVVAAQAVLPLDPARAAAEGQPRDARRGHSSAGRGQAVLLRRRVELRPGAATAHPRPACGRVDLDGLHRAYVDHQAVVVAGRPGDRVSTGAHGHRQQVLLSALEGRPYVGRALAGRDQSRLLVDHRVEQLALLVVLGVSRTYPLHRRTP